MNDQYRILAIDPGTTQSAWLRYDPVKKLPIIFEITENTKLLAQLRGADKEDTHLVVEMFASYGMAVGRSVFETCVWIGRFVEAWGGEWQWSLMYRKDVTMYLCNSRRAKDGNVRQALIDRYEPLGGGKVPQIGTKAEKGPLYGISKDVWSALGLAVTWAGKVYGN